MKALTKTLAAIAICTVPALTAVTPAHAYQGEVVRLQNEGFAACRSLGKSGYTAVVRGRTVNGAGGGRYTNGFDGFSVRYCFAQRAQCERFIDRIPHLIRGVWTIRYANCSSRA